MLTVTACNVLYPLNILSCSLFCVFYCVQLFFDTDTVDMVPAVHTSVVVTLPVWTAMRQPSLWGAAVGSWKPPVI